MPVKNKKPKKIKAKRKKPEKRKVAKKKLVKKRKKTKLIKPVKIKDLAKQLPEDKYTQALLNKEELDKKKPAANNKQTNQLPIIPKKKFKATKSTLWIIVGAVFFIIFIGWLFSLQFTLQVPNNEPGIVSSFTNNFSDSINELKKTMNSLKPNVNKLESAANTNINGKKNINALTDEQLKQMEEKVFPKLKNNINKE